MIQLYIIRHGKTVWNQENRLQGSTDIELLEESRDLARNAGKRYKDVDFDLIFSSPLNRAFETAVNFSEGRNISIIKDNRLKELCFGILEGKTYSEAESIFPPFSYFFSEPWKYEKPPKGESLQELYARIKDFITTEIESRFDECSSKKYVITAHGAVNAAISSYLRGQDEHSFWGNGLQKNLEASVFVYDGKIWKEQC